MLFIGKRIIYNKNDGEILFIGDEVAGDVLPKKEIKESDLGLLDLEYGQYSSEFSKMKTVRVDIETKELVFELVQREPTLQQRIEELENQILLLEDEKVGGIL